MPTWRTVGRVVAAAVAVVASGCAAKAPPERAAAAPRTTLQTYVTQLRELALQARADRSAEAAARQNGDGGQAHTFRRAGEHYRAAGALSAAYGHYAAALAHDRRDASSYEGLARVWRDWGLPALGLPDAHRAVYFAPDSASAHNTVGTLLAALGRFDAADRAFARAAELDPVAAWAWSNRCYASFRQAALASAEAHCRQAIALDPSMSAARNNLALVYAAAGDLAAADRQFAASGDEASRVFNRGIVLSAARRYGEAARAFERAAMLRPNWTLATARARQAHRLAAAPDEQNLR
jgi:tetratricopeptide (TPR) repeat protein